MVNAKYLPFFFSAELSRMNVKREIKHNCFINDVVLECTPLELDWGIRYSQATGMEELV